MTSEGVTPLRICWARCHSVGKWEKRPKAAAVSSITDCCQRAQGLVKFVGSFMGASFQDWLARPFASGWQLASLSHSDVQLGWAFLQFSRVRHFPIAD